MATQAEQPVVPQGCCPSSGLAKPKLGDELADERTGHNHRSPLLDGRPAAPRAFEPDLVRAKLRV